MSMVERVAQAITEAIAQQNIDPFSVRSFAGINPPIDWKIVSHAAITAMRDSTVEMIEAADTMAEASGVATWPSVSGLYLAMIDAALAEPVKE